MKQQNKSCGQLDIETLAQDQDLVRQIQKSRADRRNGRMYNKEGVSVSSQSSGCV